MVKLLNDQQWNVRRQVAIDGRDAAADRAAPATTLLRRDGRDPIIVDVTISSWQGLEADVLMAVMQAKTVASASPAEAVTMRTAAARRAATWPPCSE